MDRRPMLHSWKDRVISMMRRYKFREYATFMEIQNTDQDFLQGKRELKKSGLSISNESCQVLVSVISYSSFLLRDFQATLQ